jgi:hypothetical protein
MSAWNVFPVTADFFPVGPTDSADEPIFKNDYPPSSAMVMLGV